MKHYVFARHGVLALLTALLAMGCADEQTTDEPEDATESEGVRMVGIGTNGEELPGEANAVNRPVHKHQAQASSNASAGDPAHPWMSVQGPVPDPWKERPPPPPAQGGGSGSQP